MRGLETQFFRENNVSLLESSIAYLCILKETFEA